MGASRKYKLWTVAMVAIGMLSFFVYSCRPACTTSHYSAVEWRGYLTMQVACPVSMFLPWIFWYFSTEDAFLKRRLWWTGFLPLILAIGQLTFLCAMCD